MPDTSDRQPRTSLLLVLVLQSVTVVLSSSNPNATCPLKAYEPVHEPFRLENGSLWAGIPEQRYLPSQYRNNTNGTGYEVYVFKCVFKCCPMDEILNYTSFTNRKCIPSNKTLDKELVPKFVNESGPVEKYEPGQLYLFYQKELICKQALTRIALEPGESFGITKDGSFYLDNSINELIASDKFCIDWSNTNDVKMVAKFCWHKINTTRVGLVSHGINLIKKVLIIVSILLLILTFLVYAIVKKLRNLNGKSLMCHIAALIVAYASLLIAQYLEIEDDHSVCILIGYIIQFSFLACFFWVNVLCIDLWWTFSGLRPLTKVNLKLHESTKFKIYSIYAWGCPITISLFTFIMQKFLNGPLNPKLGENSCFFHEFWTKLIYLYSPMAVLFFIDLWMFIYTAWTISKKIKDTKIINHPNRKRKIDHDKQRFLLFFKLFIVMGINWTAEIIPICPVFRNIQYFTDITDIINALHGVFICIIFVCKKRVLRLLCEVLCPGANLFKKPIPSSTKTRYSSVTSKGITTSHET